MTKLKELKADWDAAWDAAMHAYWYDSRAAYDAAMQVYEAADAAYKAELEKTQEDLKKGE